MSRIVNIAAYKFLPLRDLRACRERLQKLCSAGSLKGTILLSPEGINLFVAGTAAGIEQLLSELRGWPGLADLQPKVSETDEQPFRRMLVRLKKEIIAFGVDGIDPARHTSRKLAPAQLKQWLDEGRPVTLLDTRNNYEVKLGTFRNALSVGIDQFRDFPAAIARLSPELKEQPVVMFCTGGIRCEKAGPYMEREGYRSIWQLDGGILKYFEECGGAHYEGECFVFDQRVGLDPNLQESGSAQCFACQTPLTTADQLHPHYVAGVSCPWCFQTPIEQLAATLAGRREQIQSLTRDLPGSRPHDHLKPVRIPAGQDGRELLSALCAIFPHVTSHQWEERFAKRRMLGPSGDPAVPTRRVRAGEQYVHRTPGVIEPDVNMDVQVLHEDQAIIVLNKPAPLPMHAGGRFLRNTLQHVLETIYAPQKPRAAHRLDANTTGLVVVARTRHFAGLLQPQFATGEVSKVYLLRCAGHPQHDRFSCDQSISTDTGLLGTRAVDPQAGAAAHTDFRVLHRLPDGTALLEARPRTGRTNQIRIHAQYLGHPVCGDPTYLPGSRLGHIQTLALEAAPLCLHAMELRFRHPLTGQNVSFRAPEPAWLTAALHADKVA